MIRINLDIQLSVKLWGIFLTETHSHKALKKCDEYGQGQIAVTGNVEREQHAQENQSSLADQYRELVD